MAKITVVTDARGRVLGSVRSDPIEVDGVTLQFRPVPDSGVEYREFEVADKLLSGSVEQLHAEIEQRLKA